MKYTFLYVTRNDNYCGDSPLRFKTSLLNLVSQLSKFEYLKKHVEILIVDWNSDIPIKNHPYLQNFNSNNIIIHYLIIPPTIASKYNKRGPVSEVHAYNVGVRFSSGKYILRMDQDILIGHRFLQYLIDKEPNEKELLWSPRRDIPPNEYLSQELQNLLYNDPSTFVFQLSNRIPIWPVTEQNVSIANLLNGNGAVGIFGFSKNIWCTIGGYNENLTGWGHMEVEMKKYFLIHNCYWTNLHEILDYNFFHIYHTTHTSQERQNNNLDIFPERNQINTWGLIEDIHELQISN